MKNNLYKVHSKVPDKVKDVIDTKCKGIKSTNKKVEQHWTIKLLCKKGKHQQNIKAKKTRYGKVNEDVV